MPTHATSNEPPQSPILAAIRAREESLAAAAQAERQAELDAVMGTTQLDPPQADDQTDWAASPNPEADADQPK